MIAHSEHQLQVLKDAIFKGNNRACFSEREACLNELDTQILTVAEPVRYSYALKELLESVSTPINDHDVFLGRVVEKERTTAARREHMPHYFGSNGHMTLNWPSLLSKGLSGITAEITRNAKQINTEKAANFAENTVLCCQAIHEYSHRYAQAAHLKAANLADPYKSCLERAANALLHVPDQPANSLFEAMQSIWLIHLITSAYIGARDFGFGRLDQVLLPFYEADLQHGRLTEEEAHFLIANFLLKSNEITGTATWNHNSKPIPCHASKQYLILGGGNRDGSDSFNPLSRLILRAAEALGMPEPVITLRYHRHIADIVLDDYAAAARRLGSQVHFFNDDIIIPQLVTNGVAPGDAVDYTAVGCCRTDIPGKMDDSYMQSYHYHNMAEWLMTAIQRAANSGTHNFQGVLDSFEQVAKERISQRIEQGKARITEGDTMPFHFESILLDDCPEACLDINDNGVRYRVQGHFFGGIATVADSLYSLKRIVFEEARYDLPTFLSILKDDFKDTPALRQEILNLFPKFGNDHDGVDAIAAKTADTVLTIFESIDVPKNQVKLCGFYSLDTHHLFGRETLATPDGRLAGAPLSENQSPTYGADRAGITACLNSICKLPLQRTSMGGLNIQFSGDIAEAKIKGLLRAFLGSNGLHVGFTLVNKEHLLEARNTPEKHRSLCVRMYGFSEYFTALSPHEQQELIDRTEH